MKLYYYLLLIPFVSCGLKASEKANKSGSKTEKFDSGITMEYIVDDQSSPNAEKGQILFVHIQNKLADSMIFDTYKMIGDAAPIMVASPAYNGDIQEVFTKLSVGDSVKVTVPVDSFMRQGYPDFVKSGDMAVLTIKVVDLKTPAEMEAEKKAQADKQKGLDDQVLSKFFTEKKIKAEKTPEGVYYVVTKKGDGSKPKVGQTVNVNYTGKNLNGEAFDSNVDPKFNHVQPFSFKLGSGQVIQGWDIALLAMDKGSKMTFYIPSYLAYGTSPPPGAPFKANENLVFEIELLSFE